MFILSNVVRALEKARSTGQFNADATAALLSSTDGLLNSSSSSGLLDNHLKQEPVSPLESLGLNTENNNADSPDEEYGTKVKRRKRDV